MPFTMPPALATDDDTRARTLLLEYFGVTFCGAGAYDGAHFDMWDSSGTRVADRNRFTADDLVAVTFLSITVDPRAARRLLRDRAEEFSGLLVELGDDRDLVSESSPWPDDWAGWRLMHELRTLPEVGTTTASKLLARKRPRLRPVWDSVVSALTGTEQSQWEPMRVALRADDSALHHRLLRLRSAAGIPEQISALRVLDAICWREGKQRGLGGHR